VDRSRKQFVVGKRYVAPKPKPPTPPPEEDEEQPPDWPPYLPWIPPRLRNNNNWPPKPQVSEWSTDTRPTPSHAHCLLRPPFLAD
jgi:hypothetical protein